MLNFRSHCGGGTEPGTPNSFNIQHSAFNIRLAVWVLLISSCGLIGEPASEVPANPPRVAFGARVYSFGRLERGAPLDHVFEFVNHGGLDLNIDKVRSSCGCTAWLEADRFI